MKDVVIRTLKSRIEEINQKLNDIYASMKYFEKKYGMKTEEFHKKFLSGTLGDDMDFFKWKASPRLSPSGEPIAASQFYMPYVR